MFKTNNDQPEDSRTKTAELLNARLADCIDLQTQCKQAHWNVKGPTFIALHELFDQVNGAVEDVNDIAERAVQRGGVANGTARMVAQRSALAEYQAKTVDGRGHVEALSSALAAFGKAARRGTDQSNDLGDLDTADLFSEVRAASTSGSGSSRRTYRRSADEAHSSPADSGNCNGNVGSTARSGIVSNANIRQINGSWSQQSPYPLATNIGGSFVIRTDGLTDVELAAVLAD